MPGGMEAAKERSVTGAALECRMRPVKDGLLSAIALSAGFQQIPGLDGDAADDSAQETSAAADAVQRVRFGVALWSNIPADLPASSVLVGHTPPTIALPLRTRTVVPHLKELRGYLINPALFRAHAS